MSGRAWMSGSSDDEQRGDPRKGDAMGLIANIYKHGGQSYSNGGLSESCDKVTVVNVDGPFEPTPERPAVMLVPGNVSGAVKMVPAMLLWQGEDGLASLYAPVVHADRAGPMSGGTLVSTSDSRLGDALAALGVSRFTAAVTLHDRFETWRENEMLSR